MPLVPNSSESDRMNRLKQKSISSNYLAGRIRFANGLSGRPTRIVSGTGSSGESSAILDILVGDTTISPTEYSAIVDANSAAPTPIVYGSILFESGAYLTTGLNTNFSMGTSDFTAECWANSTVSIGGGWTNIVSFGSASGKDIRIAAGGDFYSPNGGKMGFIIPNNAYQGRIEISYDLAHQYWNRGIMTKAIQAITKYAFKEFHYGRVNRVEAFVSTANLPSKNLLMKCGFVLEGILRQHRYHRGAYVDVYSYSLLKSDFANLTSN